MSLNDIFPSQHYFDVAHTDGYDSQVALETAFQSMHEHLQSHDYIPPYIYSTSLYYYNALHQYYHVQRGKSITKKAYHIPVISACVYYSFKRHSDTRTPHEICQMFLITKKQLTRGCQLCSIIPDIPIQGNDVFALFIRHGNQWRIPYPWLSRVYYKFYLPHIHLIDRYNPIAAAAGLLSFTVAHYQCESTTITVQEIAQQVGLCYQVLKCIQQTLLNIAHDHDIRLRP